MNRCIVDYSGVTFFWRLWHFVTVKVRFLRKGWFQAVWLVLGMWGDALGLGYPWHFRICVMADISSVECGESGLGIKLYVLNILNGIGKRLGINFLYFKYLCS